MSASAVENAWDCLRQAVERIYQQPDTINRAFIVSIYTEMYNCFTTYRDPSPAASRRSAAARSDSRSRSSPMNVHMISLSNLSTDFYNRMLRYIASFVGDVKREAASLDGEQLLEFFSTRWQRFVKSSKILRSVCDYSKRDMFREMIHTEDECPYKMAVKLWWEHFLYDLIGPLTDVSLQLINRDRCGEPIDIDPVRSLVSCLVEVDEVENQSTVYKHFETLLVGATKTYYAEESARLISNGIMEFTSYVCRRLTEEEGRARFLHCTEQPLLDACQLELIEAWIPQFFNEFDNMLQAHDINGVEAIYRTLMLAPQPDNILDNFANTFMNFVLDQGQNAIMTYVLATTGQQRKPTDYVNVLLNVYKEYHNYVMLHLGNQPCFVEAFDRACSEFINANALTRVCDQTISKPAKVLAQHCDVLLRRARLNGPELQDALDDVIAMFKYIRDTDMFENLYSRFLGLRYISDAIANEDAEMTMISKLQDCCGVEYTHRLRTMCSDMQKSRAELNCFRQHIAASDPHDAIGLGNINIKTIGYGYWHLQPVLCHSSGVPEEILRRCEQFTEFYLSPSRHVGRKLTWMYHLFRGDVTSTCFSKNYIFTASAFQMSVLLQYNNGDSFTVVELQQNTQMSMEVLQDAVLSLLKHNILECDYSDGLLPDEALFSLNYEYQSNKIRNGLCTAPKLSEDLLYLNKMAKENRPYVAKAAIVRIMKHSGKMEHDELCNQVVAHLQGYFVPTASMIKGCIDILLRDNYLQRDDEDYNTYCYVPSPEDDENS